MAINTLRLLQYFACQVILHLSEVEQCQKLDREQEHPCFLPLASEGLTSITNTLRQGGSNIWITDTPGISKEEVEVVVIAGGLFGIE